MPKRRFLGRVLKLCRKHLHEWTPENTIICANGQRRCKACDTATRRSRIARYREWARAAA
jgi:hypothetical protein